MQAKDTAREWLRANGYEQIAQTIDEIMDEWKAKGLATRRNWWETLAGDSRGNPRKVAGRTFPIIRAARQRQALPDSDKAHSNVPTEAAPEIRSTPRWPTRRKPNRRKRKIR